MHIDRDLFMLMVASLKYAATTFRRYEELHRAKGTTESELKAVANQIVAEHLEIVVNKATAKAVLEPPVCENRKGS